MPKDIKENELGDRMMTGISHSSGIVNPGMASNVTPPTAAEKSLTTGHHTINQYGYDSGQGVDKSDINAIKGKVTPDEIIAGIDYELKRMVNKDKDAAKKIVVDNLKKDPKYYSSLNMIIKGDERIGESNDAKKQAFESIFSEIKKRNLIKQNRDVDNRVINAYVEVFEKLKNKRKRI